MRHMITTACCLMLLAAVQGTALADPLKVPGPPPTDDRAQALTSCQADLKLAIADGAECRGVSEDAYLEMLRHKGDATTTTMVVTRPAPPKGKWRTRIEDVPAGDKRCPNGGTVELTGRDKNRNGKLDDKEVTGRSYACKGGAGDQGSQGASGAQGEKGDRGSDGLNSLLITVKEPAGKHCSAGGQHLMFGLDGNRDAKLQLEEVDDDAFICDGAPGKAGSSGRPGRDGNTFIQVGLGARAASIMSAGRPTGWSVAPELQLELWLSPTVEFTLGTAWASGGDRNMVVTGQLCRRALNKRLGFCLGGQYHGWNLEGNLAQWHSGLGIASLKVVPIETKYVDVSLEAGGGVGFDGYDEDMQFAYGFTGQGTVTLKF